MKKLWCITVFALFNVVLVTVDIVTDSVSAYYHFMSRDYDYLWGICTTVPIFLPFLIRLKFCHTEVIPVISPSQNNEENFCPELYLNADINLTG